MQLLTRKDLTGYLIELVVVVLGILIAFQVEEWRDGLQVERDRYAALVRLNQETDANLHNCRMAIPINVKLARSVQRVLQSVQSGQLRDADIGDFEYGLTHIGFLPARALLTTVAEEMISTGLLKELDNASLQNSISSALVLTETYRLNIANQSRFLQSIVDELARSVEYHYAGAAEFDEVRRRELLDVFEDNVEVTYDFASLASNRYLSNLLVETADGYSDLYRMNYEFCARINEIDDELAKLRIE